MNLLYLILQAAPQGNGMGGMLWLFVAMILIIWLMGGSQRKQAKREQEFRKAMKKGDRVLCGGSLYGKVHEVGETTVEVELANGVVATVEKSAVTPAPEENPTADKNAKK